MWSEEGERLTGRQGSVGEAELATEGIPSINALEMKGKQMAEFMISFTLKLQTLVDSYQYKIILVENE